MSPELQNRLKGLDTVKAAKSVYSNRFLVEATRTWYNPNILVALIHIVIYRIHLFAMNICIRVHTKDGYTYVCLVFVLMGVLASLYVFAILRNSVF